MAPPSTQLLWSNTYVPSWIPLCFHPLIQFTGKYCHPCVQYTLYLARCSCVVVTVKPEPLPRDHKALPTSPHSRLSCSTNSSSYASGPWHMPSHGPDTLPLDLSLPFPSSGFSPRITTSQRLFLGGKCNRRR